MDIKHYVLKETPQIRLTKNASKHLLNRKASY